MKNVVLIFLFLFSVTIQANSRGQLITNIARLSERVGVIVGDSEVSNEELRLVQEDLKNIVDRLRNRGGTTSCLEFTLDIYERTYAGSTALKKAQEACKRITDTSLVKFVFEIYLESYTERFALDKAIDSTEGNNYRGKSEELEFIFTVYKENYTSRFAIDKSLEKIVLLPRNSMDCLEISYRSLSRSYTSKHAMDKAIDSCSNPIR
ncbi:hypothetical protein [Halobacteriovorax sp. JY17]|uniref:hypothetical protein n=1 Tax=Halobacteriovorax sp. JY17 TaxID=2014617 RepID=UPI000C61431C|nr:hypothetical protein [Halobacteriovorax sp. JY17]PIK15702.1 MAG: hypothetical protein CES88_02950 [Halobacteriovorax sp. JY17]